MIFEDFWCFFMFSGDFWWFLMIFDDSYIDKLVINLLKIVLINFFEHVKFCKIKVERADLTGFSENLK